MMFEMIIFYLILSLKNLKLHVKTKNLDKADLKSS